MRLFVVDETNNEKIYLSLRAGSKRELETKIGGWFFTFENRKSNFSITHVKAELDHNHEITGAIVGAILGLMIPTLNGGIIIGMALGYIMGQMQDFPEKQQCETFNNS